MPSNVQAWIDTLLFPFNSAIAQFTAALNNQLTITDNMVGTVKYFNLKVEQFPFTFNHGLNIQPRICFIGQINDTSGSPATFTVAPYLQWRIGSASGTITIQTITGLDPSQTYAVTLVILAN